MGEQNVYPGPVDNSGLLKGKENKPQKIKPFSLHSHSKQCSEQKGTKEDIVHWFQRVAYLGALSNLPAYLFFAHWDKCHTNVLFATPFSLLDGDVLAIKEHLIDELDYILVPTEGWIKLVSWYGLTEGQEPIARKVILNTIWLSVINVITPINANFWCW